MYKNWILNCENWILWYAYLQPFPAVMFAFGVLDVATQTEKFRKYYESHEDFLPDTRVVEVTAFWAPLTECLVLKKRELFGQAVGQT